MRLAASLHRVGLADNKNILVVRLGRKNHLNRRPSRIRPIVVKYERPAKPWRCASLLQRLLTPGSLK